MFQNFFSKLLFPKFFFESFFQNYFSKILFPKYFLQIFFFQIFFPKFFFKIVFRKKNVFYIFYLTLRFFGYGGREAQTAGLWGTRPPPPSPLSAPEEATTFLDPEIGRKARASLVLQIFLSMKIAHFPPS